MKSLLARASFFAACFAAPHAWADSPGNENTRAVDISVEARKSHEECLRIEAGEKRRYHWRASAPVDFNVHFHRGDEVVYPIKRDGMRGDGGTFVAKTGGDYCWMWTARNTPARIEGGVDLKWR
jgi:hypothetical protein